MSIMKCPIMRNRAVLSEWSKHSFVKNENIDAYVSSKWLELFENKTIKKCIEKAKETMKLYGINDSEKKYPNQKPRKPITRAARDKNKEKNKNPLNININ